jgi:hypothetical protein
MAKINTVNVIEVTEDNLCSIKSFTEDDGGNKEAEELFIRIIKEQEGTDDLNFIGDYLDEGYYEQGNYELYLIHS